MQVIEALRRSGFGIGPDRTIRQAAFTMERGGVGALAVVEGQRLVGIVTDRDLVRRGLAVGAPPEATVATVMTSPVVTIDADAQVHDAYASFRAHAVRRLAVVRDDEFVGMITVDDLLIDLANDLADLSRPVMTEVVFPGRDSQRGTAKAMGERMSDMRCGPDL